MTDEYLMTDYESIETASKVKRANDQAALKALMATKHGREYARDLLDRMGVDSDGFGEAANTTAYVLGRRSAGLMLVNDLKHYCRDEYIQMIAEGFDNDTTN